MRKGCALSFAPAEKSSSARLRLFDCRDRRIAQDKFFQLIGHVENLGKSDAKVYSECTPRPGSLRSQKELTRRTAWFHNLASWHFTVQNKKSGAFDRRSGCPGAANETHAEPDSRKCRDDFPS